MKMSRCEDEKMFYRPPLLEEPCAQTLSGNIKSQKNEDTGARKGRKVAKHCVFAMICGSGGSKSRVAKAAGAEPAGQMRDKQIHTRRCGAKHISKSKCTKHSSHASCNVGKYDRQNV